MKPKACLLLIAVCGVLASAQAQYTSRLGRFRVDQKKGCAPFTINVTILAPAKCDGSNPCDMDYESNNKPQSLTFSHTYTQAGTFLLKILFQTSGFDDIQVEVTPNTQPTFEIYTCGNNEVSVNITDKSYNQYIINFNDGSAEVTKPVGNGAKANHTYATSGNKTVSVRGRNLNVDGTVAADNCSPAVQNVTALASLTAPTITQLQVLDASTIQLDYNALPNILYKLEIATNTAGPFQLLKNSYNVISEKISNLKTDDNFYCFRLGAFDPCNNITQYSNTICSANFDLSIQNNSNNSTWVTSASGISNFRLNRTSPGNSFTTTVTGTSYNDTNVICGTQYCYQLTTNYPNNSKSISLQKCGTAISTNIPTSVENITAIVGQPALDLRWQQVIGFTPAEFSIYKSIKGAYSLLGKTTNLQIKDDFYLTEDETCYKISYKDVCNNESPFSAEACPVRLSGNLQKDNSINLVWTPYTGWRNGVSDYRIEKYSAQGQLLQTFTGTTALTFVDDTQDLNNQIYIYLIKVNATEAGLPQAVSNPITIIKDPNLFYPTAFTPNGDNLNDLFNVYGQYIVNFEMNIFNRWGELMFSTTDLEQGWNGDFKGNPMPEGTYTFVVGITDRAGRAFKKSGSVLLLRKRG
jgi:gliding motility-associated-like protein